MDPAAQRVSETPVACTLTAADLSAQTGRWERLLATVLIDRAQTDGGLRLTFRAEPGVGAELRALVDVETECCRWARWSVQGSDDTFVLAVESSGAGVETLHAMFASG